MAQSGEHTRRDFLQGRAAARALVDKAQNLVDATNARLETVSAPNSTLHLHASRRAMACDFAIQYYRSESDRSEDILAALDIIDLIEDQLTIYRDESQLITINEQAAAGPVEVEPGLFSLLETCSKLYQETDGAFDITSTPLSRTWGFLRREGRLPEDREVHEALERVGFDKVILDSARRTIQFTQPGVEINLNSIGKGYALDQVAAFLDELNLPDYLGHGGRSSVLARGRNRVDADESWTLGLRHPLKPERRLAEFHLRDRSLATAGGATQFFEHNGRKFSHILDPRTGWPVDGIYTATVIAPTAAEADALATAFYVMGPEQVSEYCSTRADIGAVLVCPNEQQTSVSIHAYGLKPIDWSQLEVE